VARAARQGIALGPDINQTLTLAHQARVDCDHERAKGLYEAVLGAAPDHHEARWGYGLVLGFLGFFDESLVELHQAAQSPGAQAQWVFDLAMTEMMLGDYNAARPNFQRAIKLDKEGRIAERARKQLSYF